MQKCMPSPIDMCGAGGRGVRQNNRWKFLAEGDYGKKVNLESDKKSAA